MHHEANTNTHTPYTRLQRYERRKEHLKHLCEKATNGFFFSRALSHFSIRRKTVYIFSMHSAKYFCFVVVVVVVERNASDAKSVVEHATHNTPTFGWLSAVCIKMWSEDMKFFFFIAYLELICGKKCDSQTFASEIFHLSLKLQLKNKICFFLHVVVLFHFSRALQFEERTIEKTKTIIRVNRF